MPQPTSSDAFVNIPLTNLSIAFIQDDTSFIADEVFPTVPVQRQGGLFLSYDRSYWFSDTAQERAPATESAGGGYTLDWNNSYFCHKYAIHKDIDDDTRANALPPADMDRDGTEWVTQKLLIRREVQWASKNFVPSVWTGNLTGVSGTPTSGQFKNWDVAGSTPIEDITAEIIRVTALTGYKPNKLVLAPDVYIALLNHAEFVDRIKYGQAGVGRPAVMSADFLAQVLGVDAVLVPWSVVNSAAEGLTATYNFTMSNGALLVYANPSPSILKPSGGYTFVWTGLLGAGAAGARIKSYRMEWIESDRIEGEIAFDPHVVAPDVGVFFSNCLSVA